MTKPQLGLQIRFSMYTNGETKEGETPEYEFSHDDLRKYFDFAFHVAAHMCGVEVNMTNYLDSWRFTSETTDLHTVFVNVDSTIAKRKLRSIVLKMEMMLEVMHMQSENMESVSIFIEELTHVTAFKD